MKSKIGALFRKAADAFLHRKEWRRVVSTLACIVVFITVYALILPAITAEHKILECGVEVHSHDQTCYDESGALTCGKVDYVVHTHDDNCYDSDGELICDLPEIQEHQHTDSCYEEVDGEKVLTCGKDEVIVHKHDENCYDKDGNLICDQTEILSHQHDDSCFVTVDNDEDYGIMMLAEDGDDNTGNTGDTSSSEDIYFKDFVTDVLIQYQKWENDIWHDLTKVNGVYPITSDMTLRFQLTYKLPENTLSTDNSTIYYQLPKEIKIQAKETGKVTNTGGTIIGNYTIDTNGKISITFTDASYIAGNSSSELIGYIAFEMAASDFLENNPDNTGITFSDGVSVTIQKDDVITDSNDLKVKKKITTYNDSTGEITYTVTVTSEGGTSEAVILKDTGFASIASLTGNNGEIAVIGTGSEGNVIYSGSVEISSINDGFSLTIPQMAAGSTYTFSYTTKLNSMVFTGTKTENNTISAESKNQDNRKITSFSYETHDFKQELLSKTGTVDEKAGTVTWKITINKSKADITNWTLSDVFNQKDYTGEVMLTDSNGNQKKVNLPYTFTAGEDNCTDTYTVTYTTTDDVVIGNSKVANTATLTAPNGGGSTSVDGAGEIPAGETYNPLKKSVAEEGMTDSKDGTTATIPWNVTINTSRGPIPADQSITTSSGENIDCWYYLDNLTKYGTQWITKAQLEALEVNIQEALQNIGYSSDSFIIEASTNNWSWTSMDQLSSDETYRYFRILFTEELAEGKTVEFSYVTTASIENLTSETTYQNEATINDKVYSKDSVKHPANTWSVNKMDQLDWNSTSTTHSVYGLSKNDDGNPIMKWEIVVNAPDGYNDEITFTEQLPEGTTATYFQFRAEGEKINGAFEIAPILNTDGTWNWTYPGADGLSFTIQISYDSATNSYTFKIPSTLSARSSVFHLVVQVTIDDLEISDSGEISVAKDAVFKNGETEDTDAEGKWIENTNGDLTKSYQNTLTVSTPNEEGVAIGDQTQVLTADNPGKTVQKTHGEVTEENSYNNNVIPYEVVINPLKLDLVDGDTVTFIDTMTYQYSVNNNSGSYSVSLINGSFIVYYEDDQGEWQKLDTSKYSFVYDTDIQNYEGYTKGQLTLTAKIPDKTKLKIVYQYLVSGQYAGEAQLNNSAEITGSNANGVKDEDQVKMRVQTSSAGIQMSGVDFVKVDAENTNKILTDAQFVLYKWSKDANNGAGGYVFLCNVKDGVDNGNDRVNYANGVIDITHLDLNTAYMLIETVAPTGYVLDDTPYEFYVAHQGDSTFIGPTDFTGDCLLGGTQIYIKNKKNDSTIKVEKKWQDLEGNDTDSPTVDSVNFTLYQRATTDPDEEINIYGQLRFYAGDNDARWNGFLRGLVGNNEYYDYPNAYLIGSTVTIRAWARDTRYDNWRYTLTVNGEEVEGKAVEGNDGLLAFDFDIKITDPYTAVTITNTSADLFQSWEVINVSSVTYQKAENDTELGTFTITKGEDGLWQWSSDNEDKLKGKILLTAPVESSDSTETEENGDETADNNGDAAENAGDSGASSDENNDESESTEDSAENESGEETKIVYYRYYIVEENSPYYMLLYVDNDKGIDEGTITLTNQDLEKTVYNLPQTGGFGPEIFRLAGVLIVLTASGLIVLQLKKRGEV